MTHVTLKVDQAVRIGRGITVSPTDIDDAGVRVRARGRTVGGPDDGATFDTAHELTVGQSVHLGPHVAVTLIAVLGAAAQLGVFAPPNLPVAADGKAGA